MPDKGFAGVVARVSLILLVAGSAAVPRGLAQSDPPHSRVYATPAYVSNFELYAAGARPSPEPNATAGAVRRAPDSPGVYNDADIPSLQARQLTDFFAVCLVQSLTKRGLSAVRAEGQQAAAGALIRGVFAEPDARNRIRRALLGGSSPNARFLLYVGIFNLARQEEPLYQAAPVQSSSERYGPVITLNAYIPLAKYELDRNPSEQDVKKICEQIAASLVSLLEKNPDAFPQ